MSYKAVSVSNVNKSFSGVQFQDSQGTNHRGSFVPINESIKKQMKVIFPEFFKDNNASTISIEVIDNEPKVSIELRKEINKDLNNRFEPGKYKYYISENPNSPSDTNLKKRVIIFATLTIAAIGIYYSTILQNYNS